MKKLLTMLTLASLSASSATAFAQTTGAPPPASGTATSTSTGEPTSSSDEKKIGIGGDLQFILPIGDMADVTGPQIGPILRAGYRVIPALELTGRIGYLFGLNKSQSVLGTTIDTNISNIPIWVGARYFFMDAPAGAYAGAELALNIMSANASAGGASSSKGVTREGLNLGAGYVISKELPIDIRAQFSFFNLLGKETGETTMMGIGLSAGYTYSL